MKRVTVDDVRQAVGATRTFDLWIDDTKVKAEILDDCKLRVVAPTGLARVSYHILSDQAQLALLSGSRVLANGRWYSLKLEKENP